MYEHALRELNAPQPLNLLGKPLDVDPRVIFECLSPRNLVAVFLCCLLECKVVVVSALSVSFPLLLGEFVTHCMSPLKYCHVYAPVLPRSAAEELLQCPTPFLIGLSRAALDSQSLPADLVVVDADNDTVLLPPGIKDAMQAGELLVRQTTFALRPLRDALDRPLKRRDSCERGRMTTPVELCQMFVKDLLNDLEASCVLFEESGGRLALR